MGVEQDVEAHASMALQRAREMYVRTPDATHRRLVATAAAAALSDGLPKARVLFWLDVTRADLGALLESLKGNEVDTGDERYLVQVQPATGQHPTDAMPRYSATLADAEVMATEIYRTIGSSDARIFITDERTGEQHYRRQDGSWAPMSGPIDYGSEA